MWRGSWIGGGGLGVRDGRGGCLLYVGLLGGVGVFLLGGWWWWMEFDALMFLVLGFGVWPWTWVWHSGRGVCLRPSLSLSLSVYIYLDGSDHGPGWEKAGG